MHPIWQVPIEEIRDLYLNKGMTQLEIAQKYHANTEVLRRRMKREGIPLRSKSEVIKLSIMRWEERRPPTPCSPPTGPLAKWPPKDELYELYINQGLSLSLTGIALGLSAVTISNALKGYGIPIRKAHFNPAIYKDSPWDIGFYSLYHGYQREAVIRHYCFELTEEQFYVLIKQNCYYCGKPPTKKHYSSIICNGVDRADNDKGYTVENSRPCCKTCNKAKSRRPEQEFIEWILCAADHLRKSQNGGAA